MPKRGGTMRVLILLSLFIAMPLWASVVHERVLDSCFGFPAFDSQIVKSQNDEGRAPWIYDYYYLEYSNVLMVIEGEEGKFYEKTFQRRTNMLQTFRETQGVGREDAVRALESKLNRFTKERAQLECVTVTE